MQNKRWDNCRVQRNLRWNVDGLLMIIVQISVRWMKETLQQGQACFLVLECSLEASGKNNSFSSFTYAKVISRTYLACDQESCALTQSSFCSHIKRKYRSHRTMQMFGDIVACYLLSKFSPSILPCPSCRKYTIKSV